MAWRARRGVVKHTALLEQLAQAERYCAQGAEHVERQAQLIAVLDGAGRDTADARRLLAEFQGWHGRQLAERERLEGLLADL